MFSWLGCIPLPTKSKGGSQMAQLTFRRNHPGGGALGRCSYGVPGVPGIVVFDLGLFPGGVAPATIELNVNLSAPTVRAVAGVTSAVVATANVEQASATGAAIASPAKVAKVAAKVGKAVTSVVLDIDPRNPIKL